MKKRFLFSLLLLSFAAATCLAEGPLSPCGGTYHMQQWQIQSLNQANPITGSLTPGDGTSFTIQSGLDQGFLLIPHTEGNRQWKGDTIWCASSEGESSGLFGIYYDPYLYVFKDQVLVHSQALPAFTCPFSGDCDEYLDPVQVNYGFQAGTGRYTIVLAEYSNFLTNTRRIGVFDLGWQLQINGIDNQVQVEPGDLTELEIVNGTTAESMTWASFYYNPPATTPVSFQPYPASKWRDWNGGKATNYGNILQLNSNADIREVTWVLQGPGIEPYSVTHQTGSGGLVAGSQAATFHIPEETTLGQGLPETGWQLTLITVDRFGNTNSLESPISSLRPIFPRTIKWKLITDDTYGTPQSVTEEYFVMQRSGRTEFLSRMAFAEAECVSPFGLKAVVEGVGKNDDPESFQSLTDADYQFGSLIVYQDEIGCSLGEYDTIGSNQITPNGVADIGRDSTSDHESWSLHHERIENSHAVALVLYRLYDARTLQHKDVPWIDLGDPNHNITGANPDHEVLDAWLTSGESHFTTFIQRRVGSIDTEFQAQFWDDAAAANGPINSLSFNPFDTPTPLFVSASWASGFHYDLNPTAVIRYNGSVIHTLDLNSPTLFPNSQGSNPPQLVDISLPGDGALAIPGEAQLELTFHLDGSNDPTTDRRLTLTLVPTQLEPDLDRITIDHIENASFNGCDGSSDLEIGLSADTESPTFTGFVWSWQWNSRFWDESSNQWATPLAGESQPWYTVGGTSAFSGLWTPVDLGNGSFSIQPAPNADPFAGIGNTFVPTTERHVTLHIKPVFSDGSEGEAVQETFLLTKIEDGNLSALEAATGQGTYTQTLHLQEGYAGSISFQAQTDAGDQSALLEIAVDGGTYTNLTNSGVTVQFQSGSVSTYQFTIPNTHALFSAMTSLGSHTVQLRVAGGCAQGTAMEIQVSNGEGFVVRVHYRDHIGSTTLSRALSRQPVNQGDQAELTLLVDGGNETLLLYPQEEERAHYTPWGAPILSGEQEVVHGRYTDHEYDSLSTFNYMKGRYQLPGMGIFNRPDPMRDWDWDNPASINLYQYVRNNPINNFDPNGFQSSENDAEKFSQQIKELLNELDQDVNDAAKRFGYDPDTEGEFTREELLRALVNSNQDGPLTIPLQNFIDYLVRENFELDYMELEAHKDHLKFFKRFFKGFQWSSEEMFWVVVDARSEARKIVNKPTKWSRDFIKKQLEKARKESEGETKSWIDKIKDWAGFGEPSKREEWEKRRGIDNEAADENIE